MFSLNKIILKVLCVGVVSSAGMLQGMNQDKDQDRTLRSKKNWTPTATKNLNNARKADQKNLTHLNHEVKKAQQRQDLQIIPYDNEDESYVANSNVSFSQTSAKSFPSFKKLPTMSRKEKEALEKKETNKAKRQAQLEKKQQAHAIALQSRYAQLNQQFTDVDAFILETTETPDSKKRRRIPFAPLKSKNSETILLGSDKPSLNWETEIGLSFSSSEENTFLALEVTENNPFITPEKKYTNTSSQFSDTRPAVLRHNQDKNKRIYQRAAVISQHQELSGGTWDNRAQRNLVEGRK